MIFSARVFKNPKVPRQVLPRRAKDRNFTSDTVDKIHYLPCQHYLPCLLAIGQGWISRICAVNFVVIAVVVLELKFHEKITRMTHFVVYRLKRTWSKDWLTQRIVRVLTFAVPITISMINCTNVKFHER